MNEIKTKSKPAGHVRWDERCPHCNEKIAVYDHFMANDYSTEFSFDCPSCDRLVRCDVQSVPEFGLYYEASDE